MCFSVKVLLIKEICMFGRSLRIRLFQYATKIVDKYFRCA